ncbi:hypothetical protein EOA19_22430 [Mesorhizobium sp. M7A.F.Ca.US.010.02.1.1]|nr:hypothetical protein EOA19_22430 [Mesorhizobium sp. M7A.F.Ca.US.010.02.1.1]
MAWSFALSHPHRPGWHWPSSCKSAATPRDSPPLSCRTSPPHGGRLAPATAALFLATSEIGESCRDIQSPHLWGEMSGRTEGAP